MADLTPGSSFGPYRIESLLGRGGMSVVYLAEDTRLARRVAIKVLAPELAADEAFRSRFVRESQLAAGLDHPNIVPVFEAGELDGQLFIAMRYVGGTDLRTLIVRDGPLTAEHTVALLRPIASALDAAHRRGLVHRDVKPANILIAADEDEEHVYLSDFGLTKHTSSRSGLTRTGQFMGTVDYVAPEQIQGQDVDGRADEYSLACVLYECLTGNVPFVKDSDVAILFGHIQDPPPTVTSVRPELSPEIDGVVARAMAKEPDERFPTCVAMMEAAARALGAPSGPREAPGIPPWPAVPPMPVAGTDGTDEPPSIATPSEPAPAPPSEPAPVTPTPASTAKPVSASSVPTAGAGEGGAGSPGNRRVVMWFAAGGIALAAVIVVVGLLLTGGSDERNPGPGQGSGPTAGTGSTAPPPPIEAANASAIKIRDAGEAVPYPSAIDVSDAAGVVADVDVTLHGFSHTYPDDVGVVLVGPGGESVLLMSDVGGNNDHAVSGLDLTFDDEAGRGLSDKASLRAGTFLPTTGSDKGGGNCCGFTGRNPAPRPPYGRALSVFDGTDPTGTWDLYVADDSGGDQGRITGGWSLEIELVSGPVTPSPSASSSASAGPTGPTGATAASGATGAAAIFRDDFSDPSSGWDVFQDPKTSASYQDGRYLVTAAGGFRVSGDINTSTQQLSELGDVRVEVTGQLLSGPSALYGVICRAVSPTDYYYFLVQGNGDYYIGESAADRASNFDTGFSPSIATGLASNRIAAECTDGPSGVSLRLSVNGVAVNTVIDSEHPLGPGGTGVRVESRRDDMAAAFDDYVVSAPAGA